MKKQINVGLINQILKFCHQRKNKRTNFFTNEYTLVAATGFEPTTTQFVNEYSTSLASLARLFSVRLRTKWLWVRIPLLSLKLQIWRLFRARSFLTFRQTIECGFALKLVRDVIITYNQYPHGFGVYMIQFCLA